MQGSNAVSRHWPANGLIIDSKRLCRLRNPFHRRRKPVQTVNYMEVSFAALSSDQAGNRNVAWT
jgi:hypothetical protein